ncbi:hypothetical protein FVE85_3791 [Porphyridium purpureum]|uniref:Uncharacterized protein n=1 Tax=Porphyridium purpureum TaxID=35688 RepID=A0A5J4YNS0_PORPP|nr:hypothetical protein FVE85_3778 [Porphyridium purpureum]KAA8492353.1 hypothetical protein FVE85_3791 [Porphyridium purpureum]|eukprot:POR8693..scf249_10
MERKPTKPFVRFGPSKKSTQTSGTEKERSKRANALSKERADSRPPAESLVGIVNETQRQQQPPDFARPKSQSLSTGRAQYSDRDISYETGKLKNLTFHVAPERRTSITDMLQISKRQTLSVPRDQVVRPGHRVATVEKMRKNPLVSEPEIQAVVSEKRESRSLVIMPVSPSEERLFDACAPTWVAKSDETEERSDGEGPRRSYLSRDFGSGNLRNRHESCDRVLFESLDGGEARPCRDEEIQAVELDANTRLGKAEISSSRLVWGDAGVCDTDYDQYAVGQRKKSLSRSRSREHSFSRNKTDRTDRPYGERVVTASTGHMSRKSSVKSTNSLRMNMKGMLQKSWLRSFSKMTSGISSDDGDPDLNVTEHEIVDDEAEDRIPLLNRINF